MLQPPHDPIHHQLSQAALTNQKELQSDDKPDQQSQSIEQEPSGDHLTRNFIKQSKYVCYILCDNI